MAQQQPPQPQQKPYYIGGVKVLLPVKPYPCQLAMMAMIIKGLKHRQNCLLESPTGSGKSLALLCSTLAWQREQIETAKRYNTLLDQGVTDPDVLARAAGLPLLPPQPTPGNAQATPQFTAPTPTTQTPPPNPVASGGGFFYEDDDNDFRDQNPPFRESEMGAPESMDLDESFTPMDYDVPRRPRRLRVPKVFIGTRTHKQVEQIVKELRRTAYKDVRMVVLSSREHTCIHPIVSTSSNKNELCQELIDPNMGHSCSYYHGVNRVKTHDQLAQCGGLQGAWDIEDLVRVGHKVKACPYYTARALLASAELVICPYNYLVDPRIKESMDISLRNHVLVLDEAHNIEDCAREAASCTFTQEALREARNHLEQRASKKEACEKLASMLSALSGWIDENSDNLTSYTDYGRSGKVFTGTEIIAHLDHMGIGRESYSDLKQCYMSLMEEPNPEQEEERLSSVAKKVLGDLFLIYHYLLVDNMKHKDDYRVALIKEQVRKKFGQKLDGWINKRPVLEFQYSINFWCLNPAVTFEPISTVTHNIILTSGTLAPMTSFQSELGVSFKIHLEANHVIDQSQIFVGSVGHGPRGKPLIATYQHADTWEFQDELGELVLKVCDTVPGGILCFLPSYSMLNKLCERWQSTGVWDEIGKVKEAMTEQRKGDEFEKDMTHFYSTIRNTQVEEAGAVSGVFFMAVFRGKVSEGLDFTDDNARAVIAVGIPFPSIKDIQVDLKKKYNNFFCQTRKLRTGNEWYEIQAYRAINQALGRCIRHRYDWGALILVDLRFQRESLKTGKQENSYTRGLSKWVRNNVVHHRNFSTALSTLRDFVRNMVANPPSPPKRDEELLLPASHESAKRRRSQNSPPYGSNTCSLDIKESAQTSSNDGNCSPKPLMEPFQTISPAQSLKGSSFPSHRGCNAETDKNESSETKSSKKAEPRCGSANYESSKENNDSSLQGRKKLPTVIDDPDLDDFNLALSPSTSQASKAPLSMRKKIGRKKGVQYVELE